MGFNNRLQVYLGSNDFSLLSDPKRVDASTSQILDKREHWANNGIVEFRFSAVHVCVAAPIGIEAQEATERRGGLISRLCGTHAMLSFDRIALSEIVGNVASPFSDVGQWYSPVRRLLSPITIKDRKQAFESVLREKGLNRKQRCHIAKQSVNKNGFKWEAMPQMSTSFGQIRLWRLGFRPRSKALWYP